ncbi:hypothetical protein HZH68_004380 [Vespula germanica]|uniref:Uncharacterized protein n=1 Tax=Vespula germanica TaxID=30212 RepID=A0A834NJD0_VESGE|nr:hypothetical protein HZH68_004380 [Vespula germanica]
MGLWRLWRTTKVLEKNVDEKNFNETYVKSGPKLLHLVSTTDSRFSWIVEMCERLCLSNKRANIFSREYLTNKNLSIMTDNEPEINNVCLRKEGQWKTRTNHSTSSSNSNSSNSFIYVAVEEVSAVSEWESVTKDAITESIRVNSVSQKYCSSKSKDSWYLKLKREILKSLRNKIYPIAIAG